MKASALRAIPVASVAALRGAEATAFALNLHHLVIALAQLEGVPFAASCKGSRCENSRHAISLSSCT